MVQSLNNKAGRADQMLKSIRINIRLHSDAAVELDSNIASLGPYAGRVNGDEEKRGRLKNQGGEKKNKSQKNKESNERLHKGMYRK